MSHLSQQLRAEKLALIRKNCKRRIKPLLVSVDLIVNNRIEFDLMFDARSANGAHRVKHLNSSGFVELRAKEIRS